MVYDFALAAAVAVAVAGDTYDIILTERGIKAGVGVESDTFLIGETNTKPSTGTLYWRDTVVLALTLLCSGVAHFVGNEPLALGTLSGPVVYGIKHYLGGRKWAKLLAAQKAKTNLVQGGTGGGGHP